MNRHRRRRGTPCGCPLARDRESKEFRGWAGWQKLPVEPEIEQAISIPAPSLILYLFQSSLANRASEAVIIIKICIRNIRKLVNFRTKIPLKRFLITATIAVVGLPAVSYGGRYLSRPPHTPLQKQLFQGITYKREFRSKPRPFMIHVVTIDLTAPGIVVLVTPAKPSGKYETVAITTSEFISNFKLQLAINGSYFYPFHSNGAFDYYPHRGDPVNVIGQAISNGIPYSPSQPGVGVLCFSADNRAQIRKESCEKGTAQALAGMEIFVRGGKPALPGNINSHNELYPRTAVATDQRGEKMWLVVIDGRQPDYSEGVTMSELTDIVMELGAHTALNLDGGGSTALVAAGFWGPHSLNAPIHTRIPMRQRPVANHLGFYAPPAF